MTGRRFGLQIKKFPFQKAVNIVFPKVVDFTAPVLVESWTTVVPANPVVDPWPIVRPYMWQVWICILLIIPTYLLVVWFANLAFESSPDKVEWGKIAGFTIRTCLVESTSWYPNKVKIPLSVVIP